jgi:hypothetical protein
MGVGAPFQWVNPSTWPWMIWVWIAFLAAGWTPSLWRRLQRNRASGWPMADARIESVEVAKPRFSLTTKRGYYSAQLGYSYSVAGSIHSGTYKRDIPSEPEAYEFVRDLQGRALPAHYDPNNPSRSILLEPDVESLLQNRAPASPSELAQADSSIPEWIRPFLWLFIGIAATGLILSLWVHIGAVMGRRVAPESFFWMLHVGIFVVWIPAVFVAQRLVGSMNRRDFWKVVLKGSPDWMRYMVYGFFGYAMVNFLLFMGHAPKGGGGANPPATVWRGFSGHWMAFYSAALAILYSAAASMDSSRRCTNGHVLSPDSPDTCTRCGQPVGQSVMGR